MPKRTYQPHTLHSLKKLGYRARMASVGGVRVFKSRLAKGRKVLTKSDEYRLKKKTPNKRVR